MIKVNDKKVEYSHYPDGTLNLKADYSGAKNVLIEWHFENNEECMVLMFLAKYYKAHGCRTILFMPYVPNARMDRVVNKGDIFMMKYFGEFINSLGFDRIDCLDVHSSSVYNSINNCHFHNPAIWINFLFDNLTKENGVQPLIFFPDEGSSKRYNNVIKHKWFFGVKNRDWDTGKISGVEVLGIGKEGIAGRDILIVDDICSRGGTFYYSAKKLKELGARNIYLYVTHCENAVLEGEMINSGLIKHIFTTDSIFTERHPLISVCNVKPVKEDYFNE